MVVQKGLRTMQEVNKENYCKQGGSKLLQETVIPTNISGYMVASSLQTAGFISYIDAIGNIEKGYSPFTSRVAAMFYVVIHSPRPILRHLISVIKIVKFKNRVKLTLCFIEKSHHYHHLIT